MSTTSDLQPLPAGDTGAKHDAEVTSNSLSEAQISSPHELTDWVDNVLNALESRFSIMSTQVDTRLQEMSERIDALESSIEGKSAVKEIKRESSEFLIELIMGATAPMATGAKARQVTSAKPEAPRVNVTDV